MKNYIRNIEQKHFNVDANGFDIAKSSPFVHIKGHGKK